jgi:hypothetical protein
MSNQKITYPDYGSRAMRVLDALTPINGVAAPAINATFIGQKYIDTVEKNVYVSTAVGSKVPANDWTLTGVTPANIAADIADLGAAVALKAALPVSGAVAPAVNAEFLGQLYVDTAAKKVYISVAVGSATPTDDWANYDGAIEALEPVSGAVAPAVNAEFIGQLYLDTVAEKVYISVAVGSATPTDDWVNYDGAIASLSSSIKALEPVSGAVAPAVNAEFLGQIHIDTATPAAYIAVAVGSAIPADDWKELTFAAGL